MRTYKYISFLVISISLQSAEADTNSYHGIPWSRIPEINVGEIKEQVLSKTAVMLEKVHAYGSCHESIADCLRKGRGRTSSRLARDILLLVANNKGLDKVTEWIEKRRLMAHPKKIQQFDVEYLTPLGKKDADVMIVKFSDFQCPFCATVAPMLEDMVRASNGKACLYFKQFPIKNHPRALVASKACVASDKFGKFWEYCMELFRNRNNLTDANLFKIAERVGIDPEKLQHQMQQKEVLERISKEKVEGLKCKVHGTPSVYINGKKIIVNISSELLQDRIEEELDILHGKD